MKKSKEQVLVEYQQAREQAIKVADSLPVKTLTLEQAAALLPVHPEWEK